MGRKAYEAQLAPLLLGVDRVARWAQATGARILVLFEGRDTAGKGGAIATLSSVMNPRQCRVVALPKPTEIERSQWYFQRYIAHLPAAGQIVLFDRSWYNRAGVEKVMGWCSEAECERFLAQTPVFEQLLVDEGILLFKYWLTVDQAEQEKRLHERLDDPLKRWKLSPIDLESRTRYRDYTTAREAMLKATHTRHAPWTLVDFNDQRSGRITLIQDFLARIPDTEVPTEAITFPPLKGGLQKERFKVPPKPIRPVG